MTGKRELSSPRRLIELAAGGVVLLAIVWRQCRLLGDFRIDDAYITFSFAKNLALGHGLTYSHGARVEGYSNFLWVLLIAPREWLRPGADPYRYARALIAAFAVVLATATFTLIEMSPGSRFWRRAAAWAGLVLLAFDTDLTAAGLTALETIPYVALLTAGIALYVAGRNGAALARRATIPCFLAVALMRIDGFLALGALLVVELVLVLVERRSIRSFVRWASPGIAAYLAWFGWRWWYYGLPLPTTYYAKALIPVALPNRGYEYAVDFWLSTGFVALLPLIVVALVGRQRRIAAVMGAFVLAHTAYVIRVGGDWMPFWRFFAPIVPLLVVLAMWGAIDVLTFVGRRPVALRLIPVVGLVALCTWVGRRVDAHSLDTVTEEKKLATLRLTSEDARDHIVPAARLLSHVVAPGERLVSDYAGAMAYFTDAAVIDMWGLCNREIALRGTTEGVNPIWGKTCPPCYASFDPDYFHTFPYRWQETFSSRNDVLGAVWQSRTIGRYVDFSTFTVGLVSDRDTGRQLYFMQRRRTDRPLVSHRPAAGIEISYPFDTAR